MEECMIPGDIIMAKVLSYGDSRKVYLTTAENELGVMFAKSQLYGLLHITRKTYDSLQLGIYDMSFD
jgi:hypothetical protein